MVEESFQLTEHDLAITFSNSPPRLEARQSGADVSSSLQIDADDLVGALGESFTLIKPAEAMNLDKV